MKGKKKLLIVEAHSDDSSIAIMGFLERFAAQFDLHFLMLACSDIKMTHIGKVSRKERLAEYEEYVTHFKGTWHRGARKTLPFDADAKLDQMPRKTLIEAIEKVITQVKPDLLIFQGPSFHQDHIAVYESVLAATRPTALFCPQEMYIMENPTYVHSLGPQTDFKPDLYINLTEEEIEKKIALLLDYFPSQIGKDHKYLSPDGIKSWARYRGIESRGTYAEALMTYKRVL